MSLKAFHIFFIVLSILFALGLAVWSLWAQTARDDGIHLVIGIVSLIGAAGLVLYLLRFLKKMRNPRMS